MCCNEKLKNHILSLISDYGYDPYWTNKVINSIMGLELLFKKKISVSSVTRQQLQPKELWVVSPEELDFAAAVSFIKDRSKVTIFPVTVVRVSKTNLLYMGSVRSLYYVLQDLPIEAIIVEMPNIKDTNFFKCEKHNLDELVKKHQTNANQ